MLQNFNIYVRNIKVFLFDVVNDLCVELLNYSSVMKMTVL